VVRTLQNAITGDTLGHAYLFSGLRGVGKTTVARLLAKAVNCDQGPTPEPCGECTSCTEVVVGSSLDVVEIDGASNRKIDDVRELRDFLRYRPARDRFRVIIIDEVHMLTREAFNALLKSLEEPPPYILFVFATTERHKVPATILSRCQQLEFRPVATDLIAGHLGEIALKEGFSMTPGSAGMIARAAQGSVRDALSLVDQLRAFSGDQVDEDAVATVLGVPRFEQVARLVEALAGGRAAEGLALLRDELRAGHDATALYHEAGRVLRATLFLALDPQLAPELTEEQRTELTTLAGSLGVTPLSRMLGLWLEQEALLRDAANRELALEVACLRLSRWPAVQAVEALLVDGPASGGGPPPGPVSGRDSSGSRGGAPRRAGAAPPARTRKGDPAHAKSRAGGGASQAASEPGHPGGSSRSRPIDQSAPGASDGAQASGRPAPTPPSPPTLEEEAGLDPALALAREVLGGEVVAVQADDGQDMISTQQVSD